MELVRIPRRILMTFIAIAVYAMAMSCTVGQDYKAPELDVPAGYKSSTTQATTQVASTRPATTQSLGREWWKHFNDPKLNELEAQAIAANQDLQAAMARVVQAR